jgi:2',3'-cyclic-nucleotide 2'-phosphodiesterase (5'-nucleotidase family)
MAQRVRTGETAVGNLIADAMRAQVGADVAILNSGSIRGDRVFPAGPVPRRTVIALQPFGNVVCKIEARGSVLLAALNHGVARLPTAAGQFPQVSGLTMRVDAAAPPGDRVRDVRVGGQPLDAARTYSIALADYVLNGGDGYDMFAGQRVVVTPEAGTLVSTAIEQYLAAHNPFAPKVEGRIAIAR